MLKYNHFLSMFSHCFTHFPRLNFLVCKGEQLQSFYMPHKNMKDVKELRRSLEMASVEKDKHIILAGNFNWPDIDWQTSSVKNNAQDREMQQALLDLSIDFNLTQIHSERTRENYLLDLLFTANSSLIKSSTNTPGISDHDIVVVDSDTKPSCTKSNRGNVPHSKRSVGTT